MTTERQATEFIYRESSPKLAGKARQFGASYRRMVVAEILKGSAPTQMTERSHDVVRIVDETTASIGTSERSFGYRERARLQALAAELNHATA